MFKKCPKYLVRWNWNLGPKSALTGPTPLVKLDCVVNHKRNINENIKTEFRSLKKKKGLNPCPLTTDQCIIVHGDKLHTSWGDLHTYISFHTIYLSYLCAIFVLFVRLYIL